MDALKAASLCALLAAPPQLEQPCGAVMQVSSAAIDRWQALIEAASQRFDIPVEWIRAVMVRESAGRVTLNGHPIVSPAGAMGLMQLMPATWSGLRARYGLGSDPFDPHDNIFAGAAYLREMYDRYGYPNLFAAYHAGPGRFDNYLQHGRPLPQTTLAYANGIVPGTFANVQLSSAHRGSFPDATQGGAMSGLFFARDSGHADPNQTSEPSKPGTPSHGMLFVPLTSPTR